MGHISQLEPGREEGLELGFADQVRFNNEKHFRKGKV